MGKKKAILKKPSLKSTPLWKHQRRAVATIQKYLDAFESDNNLGSALVHMPTGTGKTGVIACASHFIKKAGCVLALCPRIALRDQLCREISGRFFTKLSQSDDLPKTVHNVKKGFPNIVDTDYRTSIISMTIQMLASLKKKHDSDPDGHQAYKTLQDNVDLIIVDEGHYEPAQMWSEAIRGIKAPRLIFTATPFRNDLKMFDVSYDYAYCYTLKQATEDQIIRKVEIHHREMKNNPTRFVEDILKFYDQNFGDQANAGYPPRVIIRCDSHAEIRQIGVALNNAGRSYVLIHENFKDDDTSRPRERCSVPDPNNEQAVFWVHQFKLLEGIDDPRFRLLAIYNEFKNTREIVQQIGRVIRNPEKEANAVGHVLDHSGGKQKELWDGFLRFDKLINEEGIQVADFGKKVLQVIQSAVPDVVYLDRRFRSGFCLDSIDPADEILLPSTVNVFRKSKGFNFSVLVELLINEYSQDDKDVRKIQVGDTIVLLYLTFSNSPLLRSTAFIECRLGVTVLHECNDYVCFYDSAGAIPHMADNLLLPVGTDELKRLFGKDENTYLTSVSLNNSNIGVRAIRSRAFSAARIDNIVPGFDEHSFICRTARGYSGENGDSIRRYVGFARGKVTDSIYGGRLKFEDYIEWLDGITSLLSSDNETIGDFMRFATQIDVPLDPQPASLLLDVIDVEDYFLTHDIEGVVPNNPMQIKDACCQVDDGQFTVTANGKECSGKIDFDNKKARYYIQSADLEEMYHSQEPGLNHGFIRYLNLQQSFRVIPKSEGSFFTLGAFYSPKIKFGPKYNDDQIGLLKVIYPFDALDTIGSEKGRVCAADGSAWDKNSLFSIIDLLGVGYGLEGLFGTPDILVCDDMNTEAADFILAYTSKNKVVFIHAKGQGSGNARKYAASPLQEVCAQATKNLKYFARYGNDEPPKARKWHKDEWKTSRDGSGNVTPTGKVLSRLRKVPDDVTTGFKAWSRIHRIIRNPNAELEVWLLLGRLFSKTSFEEQLKKKKPKTEAKQAAYLLFSTMNDVATVGARLRVICST